MTSIPDDSDPDPSPGVERRQQCTWRPRLTARRALDLDTARRAGDALLGYRDQRGRHDDEQLWLAA